MSPKASNGHVPFRIIPESIKWLITKKHYPQVKQLLLRELGANGIQSASEYVLTSRRGEINHKIDELVSQLLFNLSIIDSVN